MKLEDGTGSGFQAKIDKQNRLQTRSVSTTEQLNASKSGDSYQIGSGVITLTNTTESPVLYFKNNENEDVILTAINITSEDMTGSTDNVFLAKIYTCVNSISCGTTQTALNNNFGSSRTLCATITAGGTGTTFCGGTASGAFYIPVDTFFTTDIVWTFPKGSSIAVSATPGSGNTSFPLTITLEGTVLKE